MLGISVYPYKEDIEKTIDYINEYTRFKFEI
ncbi:hypothetical protein PSHO110982_06190 [Pseudostreptobacillus hongkongensis]